MLPRPARRPKGPRKPGTPKVVASEYSVPPFEECTTPAKISKYVSWLRRDTSKLLILEEGDVQILVGRIEELIPEDDPEAVNAYLDQVRRGFAHRIAEMFRRKKRMILANDIMTGNARLIARLHQFGKHRYVPPERCMSPEE